jgi:hypothetical protein
LRGRVVVVVVSVSLSESSSHTPSWASQEEMGCVFTLQATHRVCTVHTSSNSVICGLWRSFSPSLVKLSAIFEEEI